MIRRTMSVAVLLIIGPVICADQPAKQSITVDLGGGVTMEFVRVPAGSFVMGSPEREKTEYERCVKRDFGSSTISDEYEHEVHINMAFYIGKYPVTQQQFEAVIGKNPSGFSLSGLGKGRVVGLDLRRFPVENTSWYDAEAFCTKLSSRDGLKRTFRLPTEAEWEYACRGKTKTAYFFGDELNGNQANCDGKYPFGTDAKGPLLERTSRVGSYEEKQRHPWGLCDTHGDVWEWCQDWYDDGYYKRSPHGDPVCKDGEMKSRVMRGGCWASFARDCRSASRIGVGPREHNLFTGFRVVCRTE